MSNSATPRWPGIVVLKVMRHDHAWQFVVNCLSVSNVQSLLLPQEKFSSFCFCKASASAAFLCVERYRRDFQNVSCFHHETRSQRRSTSLANKHRPHVGASPGHHNVLAVRHAWTTPQDNNGRTATNFNKPLNIAPLGPSCSKGETTVMGPNSRLFLSTLKLRKAPPSFFLSGVQADFMWIHSTFPIVLCCSSFCCVCYKF